MKKILLLLAVLLGFVSASARDTYTHDENVLPMSAKMVLKKSFKADVNHIKIEKEWGRISGYDVVLKDGSEISFDTHGNWKEVEVGVKNSVPSEFVPDGIAKYVKQNHDKAKITGIEKKKSGYEVELSDGIEMKFDADGKFIRYDN